MLPKDYIKKDYEKQDMTKHKLGPSKEMSSVHKSTNKPKEQKRVKLEKELLHLV